MRKQPNLDVRNPSPRKLKRNLYSRRQSTFPQNWKEHATVIDEHDKALLNQLPLVRYFLINYEPGLKLKKIALRSAGQL